MLFMLTSKILMKNAPISSLDQILIIINIHLEEFLMMCLLYSVADFYEIFHLTVVIQRRESN